MDLRKATLLLTLARLCTVLHKTLFTFFRSFGDSQIVRNVTSFLWLVATTWFLIRFRRVPDYRELAPGESG